MFNLTPRVQALPIHGEHQCFVIDDALLDPDAMVTLAQRHRAAFEESPHNAFPGPELPMPDALSLELDAFFAQHVRAFLGARRTLRLYSRLAMVTRAPDALAPRQWIPHRDRFGVPADECVAASVLYLFRDSAFGGTRFFMPRRAERETAQLVHDSGTDDGAAFAARYGIAQGYPRESTDWFEHVATIPPRWNRIIFYDGELFHCSDIPDAGALSADPTRGRLTLNGFFTCRRRAT